jgi:2-keto-3-deoxy-galactonokinase
MLQASRPWRRCRLRTSCCYTRGFRARVIFAARAEQSSPTTTMAVCGELPSSTSCHVINLLVRVQTCARVSVVVCGYRRGETGWVEVPSHLAAAATLQNKIAIYKNNDILFQNVVLIPTRKLPLPCRVLYSNWCTPEVP